MRIKSKEIEKMRKKKRMKIKKNENKKWGKKKWKKIKSKETKNEAKIKECRQEKNEITFLWSRVIKTKVEVK